MPHVDEAQITAYLDQEQEYADPEKRRELGRHIADCLQCMRLLKDVRTNREGAQKLLDGSRPPNVRTPPFEAIEERARNLPLRGVPRPPQSAPPGASDAPTVPMTALPAEPPAPAPAPPPAAATPTPPPPPAEPTSAPDAEEGEDFIIDLAPMSEPASPPAAEGEIQLPDLEHHEPTPEREDFEMGLPGLERLEPAPPAAESPTPTVPTDHLDVELPGLETDGADTADDEDGFDIDLPLIDTTEPAASEPPAPAAQSAEPEPPAGFTVDLPVLDDVELPEPADDDADLFLDLPIPAPPPPAPEPVAEVPEEPEPEPEPVELEARPRGTLKDLPMINPDATGSMLAAIDEAEGETPEAQADTEVEDATPLEMITPEASLEVPALEDVAEPDLATADEPGASPVGDLIQPIGDPTTEVDLTALDAPDEAPPAPGGLELESVTDWDSGSEQDAVESLPPLEIETASLDTGSAPPPPMAPLGLEPTSLADSSSPAPPVTPPAEPAGFEDVDVDDHLVPESPSAPFGSEVGRSSSPPAEPPLAPITPSRDSDWGEPLPPDDDDFSGRRRAAADEPRPRRPWDPPEEEDTLEPAAAPAAAPSRPSVGTFQTALGGGSRKRRTSSTRKWLPIAAVVVLAVGGAGGAYTMGWFGGTDEPQAVADAGTGDEPTQLAAARELEAEPDTRAAAVPSAPPAEAPQPPVPARDSGPAAAPPPAEPVTLGLADTPDSTAAGGRAQAAPSAAQQMLAQVTDSAARVAEDLDAAAVRSRVIQDTTAAAAEEARRAAQPEVALPTGPTVNESLNRQGMSMEEARGLLGGPVIIVDGLTVESMTRIGTTDGVRVVQTDPTGRQVTIDVAPSGGVGDTPGLNSVAAFDDAGGNSSTGTARFGPYRINARGAMPASVLRGYLQRLVEAPGAD